ARARRDLELAKDVAQMAFHRLLAQDERSSDLAIALRQRNEAEDLHFAPGQTCKGTPCQTRCRIRSGRRVVTGQRICYRLIQRHCAPVAPGGCCGSLAESARGDLQPSLESFSVRWEERGAKCLAQGSRGFGQADGAPRL